MRWLRDLASEGLESVPMIDPLSPAKRLSAWVGREVHNVRRVVYFTCTCGLFPTGSRRPRQRWGIWPSQSQAKAAERRNGPSLLVTAERYFALSHTRPLVMPPFDASSGDQS